MAPEPRKWQPFLMKPLDYKLLAEPSNRDWMERSGLWEAYNTTISPVNLELLNEFIESHGEYGGKINGQIVHITPALVSHALKFPCAGYEISSARESHSKDLDSCFLPSACKGTRTGYDISLAKDPVFKELLIFIFDRIVVKSSETLHLPTALCLAGFRIKFAGNKFNWSAFICKNMQAEIRAIKERKSFECKYAQYLSMILEYSAQAFLGKACISLKTEEKQSTFVSENTLSPLSVKQEHHSSFEKEKNVVKEELSDKRPLTCKSEVVYVSSDDESEASHSKLKRPKAKPGFAVDSDFKILSKKVFQNLLRRSPSPVVEGNAFSERSEKDEKDDRLIKLEEMCKEKDEMLKKSEGICKEKDEMLKKLEGICKEKDEKLKELEKKYEDQRRELYRTTEALLNARGEIIDLSQKHMKIYAGSM